MQKNKVTDQDTPIIGENHWAHIIEQKTNIPVGDLKRERTVSTYPSSHDLKSHVIGQDDAVEWIAKAIPS